MEDQVGMAAHPLPKKLDDLRQRRLAYFQTNSAQNSRSQPEGNDGMGISVAAKGNDLHISCLVEGDNADIMSSQNGAQVNVVLSKEDILKSESYLQEKANAVMSDGSTPAVVTEHNDMSKSLGLKTSESSYSCTSSKEFPIVVEERIETSLESTNVDSLDRAQHQSADCQGFSEYQYDSKVKLLHGSQTSNMKTSSFFIENPDGATAHFESQKTISMAPVSNFKQSESLVFSTVKNSPSDIGKGYQNDLDGSENNGVCGETVERLIRATKKEILGRSVDDDIWIQFKARPTTDDIHKKTTGFTAVDDEVNKQEIDNHLMHKTPFQLQSYSSPSSERNMSEPVNIAKSTDQSSNHPRSFSEAGPLSEKTGQFEDFFQAKHSPVPPLADVPLAESQDMETALMFQKSADFSDLGLSTHRPLSGQVKLNVECQSLQLNEALSKELRAALGEEKYKEFLAKSTRDIRELQQERLSERSTGRKEKQQRQVATETKSEQQTNNRKLAISSKNVTVDQQSLKSSSDATEKRSVRSSMSETLTPCITEKETGVAVREMIEQHVLNSCGSGKKVTKKLTSNPAYKTKKVEQEELKNTEAIQSTKQASKSIPNLNLSNTSPVDSPRPKLNRPRNEPYNIYSDNQEMSTADENNIVKKVSPTSGYKKNYEQVTIPRNVVFSSSEIYNQAYGGHPGSFGGVPMSSSLGPGFGGPPDTPHGPSFEGVPLSPHQGPGFGVVGATACGPSVPMSTAGYPPPAMMSYMPQQDYLGSLMPDSPQSQVMYAPYPVSYGTPQESLDFKTSSRHSSVTSDSFLLPHPPVHFTPESQHTGMYAPKPSHLPHPPCDPKSFAGLGGHTYLGMTGYPGPGLPKSTLPQEQTEVQIQAPLPGNDKKQEYQPAVSQGYPVMTQGFAYPYPVMMMAPHPPSVEHVTAQAVAVQTDDKRADGIETCAASLMEECAFTSVSQILPQEEVLLPHPPIAKKDGQQKSPHRPSKHETDVNNMADSRRHIDGIRQHHEQRRQQQHKAEEQLTEEQNLEKQRKFAKASLDRYFSSLETLYKSSLKPQVAEGSNDCNSGSLELETGMMDQTLRHVSEDMEKLFGPVEVDQCESSSRGGKGSPEQATCAEKDAEISDQIELHENVIVKDNIVCLKRMNLDDKAMNPVKDTHHDKVGLSNQAVKHDKTVVDNKVTMHDKEDLHDNVFLECDNEIDTYRDTAVGSVVTGLSVKVGGVTDRLKELGIDSTHKVKQPVHMHIEAAGKDENGNAFLVHNKQKGGYERDKEKGKLKRGKVLLICPECDGFNKEYMSWCTHCGEMIIGVEPMLVSKNREGKIRKQPINNTKQELFQFQSDPTDKTKEKLFQFKPEAEAVMYESSKKNSVQEVQQKSFSLDIEPQIMDKSDTLEDKMKASPIKSDGKDSGRPSSDDQDLFQPCYRTEQEIIEICEGITDPIVKGYIKSHFAKKRQAVLDEKGSPRLSAKAKLDPQPHKLSQKHSHASVKPAYVPLNQEGNASHDKKMLHHNVESVVHNSANTEAHFVTDIVSVQVEFEPEVSQAQSCLQLNMVHQMPEFQPNSDLVPTMAETRSSDDKVHPVLEIQPSGDCSAPSSSFPNKDELALNIMAESMDVSQISSVDFLKESHQPQGTQLPGPEGDRKKVKSSRRRKGKGHGAIDVEIFGYEESRESREKHSSREQAMMVPSLELINSSDEDMSAESESEAEPALVQEPVTLFDQVTHPVTVQQPAAELVKPGTSQALETINPRTSHNTGSAYPSSSDWQQFFDSTTDQDAENEDPSGNPVDETEAWNDPESGRNLLKMLIKHGTKPTKSKKSKASQPSGKNKPSTKSKVRRSLEGQAYERKWARSSIAWSSYNDGELRTSPNLGQSQIGSQSRLRSFTSISDKPVEFGNQSARAASPSQTVADKSNKARPSSADLYKRKQRQNAAGRSRTDGIHSGNPTDLDLDEDALLNTVEHRLPRLTVPDLLQDHLASPQSTYDKYIEMTPRIQAGSVSRWQCLPDEILLHILAYVDQSDLIHCAQVCKQFYRVALDESLWKYITVKKKHTLNDDCLKEIAKRHPVSLALIHCHGDEITTNGLRDLFKECADCLKELNISCCSRGALTGDSLLLHAAARCHNLTHVDTSWCNVTDSGLIAISNSCNRLESLCINGCQAVSNEGFETVIKRHGQTLRVLEIFGCFNITPRGLSSLSNNCISLVSVNLGQCYKLTDSCVAQLSSSLGRVEKLHLRGLKQLKDNCVRRVVKNCPRLKDLSLANCPNITNVSILEVSTYLSDIRHVDVSGCKNITDNGIRAMANTCNNLRHLDISSTGCTHRSVSMIANLCGQRLETLKLNFLVDVTEACLVKLAKHCRRLKSVHLYGCTSARNTDIVQEEKPTFTIEM